VVAGTDPRGVPRERGWTNVWGYSPPLGFAKCPALVAHACRGCSLPAGCRGLVECLLSFPAGHRGKGAAVGCPQPPEPADDAPQWAVRRARWAQNLIWHAESEGPTRVSVTGTSRATRTAVGWLLSRRSRRSGTRSVSCTTSKAGHSVNRGSPRPRSLSATTVACASGSRARGMDQLIRAPH
jgi:hypothetical protein